MRFQRFLQIPLFALFLLLLGLAAYPLPSWLPVDLFLRLDPLLSLGSMATARAFIPRVAWSLLVIGLTLFVGRLFCGYICPMGATIDFADWVSGRKQKERMRNSFEASGRFRNFKYLFLVALGGTTLIGVSSIFFFSPLSLITRFYSFVLWPLALMTANLILDTSRFLFPWIGMKELAFFRFSVPVFNTNLFVGSLVVAILALGLIRSRFWCRNLCPAGAIFALFSFRPLFKRKVSEGCTNCGLCLRSCPMGAIGEDFVATAHSECIACLKCREICPEKAISFKVARKAPAPVPEIDLNRREILSAGLTGVAAAAVAMTNLNHLHGAEAPRALRSSRLIRPPGALPEPAFQARCVRCGECIKGCLTNTLQPVWLEAGITGLWTPKITARLAGCEQNCNVCGHLCPTGAIRPMDLEEKKFAKVGTAHIIKSRCIAWEQDKKCLICDEICPYNAISSQLVPGRPVTVPVIDENKCNGCGYCENKCPVIGESAILVEPLGELRLATGSYQEKARELGLVFHAKAGVEDHFILNAGEAYERSIQRSPAVKDKEGVIPLPPGFVPE
ncbi:MAG: 4Fe-4S binding protein [Proteobacteria bacterium]|nr:4Fe-4S binding protein [Pseudomonadota bacterium]